MTVLPLFRYPTTVSWVDDDDVLLQVATDIIGQDENLITFNSPSSFLSFISTYVPHLETVHFTAPKTECDDYETVNHLPIDINSLAFFQLPTQPERKKEISLLIVDYHMPEITGLELCRHLKNKPFKKILLTGEATIKQAVAAFNEGIIDCFLQKDSPTLIDDIKKHLCILKDEYFLDQSKSLLLHLETDKKIPLSDPIFVSFFKSWCKENEIQEYYLFDKQGNMQVVNSKGKSCFVIHTDNSLDQFCEIYGDNQDASHLIADVKERKKVPFFGIGLEGWQCNKNDWPQHFYVPEVLEGREKYYWFVKE